MANFSEENQAAIKMIQDTEIVEAPDLGELPDDITEAEPIKPVEQQAQEIPAQPKLPEKFKSWDDMAKSYNEIEKAHTKVAQENSDLRKTIEGYDLKFKDLESRMVKPVDNDDSATSFLDNPQEALKKMAESVKKDTEDSILSRLRQEREEQNRVALFFDQNNVDEDMANKMAEFVREKGLTNNPNALEIAYRAVKPEQLTKEQMLEKILADPELSQKAWEDYAKKQISNKQSVPTIKTSQGVPVQEIVEPPKDMAEAKKRALEEAEKFKFRR
jgi:hypothetical protein